MNRTGARSWAWLTGVAGLAASLIAWRHGPAALPWIPLLLVPAVAAGAALEIRRLRSELRRSGGALEGRTRELEAINRIGRQILSLLEPSQVFSVVECECRALFDADFFFVALVDRETRELRVAYRAHRDELPHETKQPLGEGLASWVVSSGQGLVVRDFRDPVAGLPFRPAVVDPLIRSCLAAPLLVGDEAIGAVSVQSRRPGAYCEHDLGVLHTIAQQTAVAMENARHYEMATVDSLTGMFLRDYFFRRLEDEYTRARRYGGSFAVLMTDLDGFKGINDSHGHIAGDRYLRVIGSTIRGRLRAADLACRYGGDEFCLLLPETDLAGAEIIARRIRTAVSRLMVKVEGFFLRTTISIGVAAFPNHEGAELPTLLEKADRALYDAKRSGRDRVAPFAA